MIILYVLLIVLVCTLVGLNLYNARILMDRRHGKLPPRGRATMFDVRYLLMEGEKDLAIKLYCEIFQTSPLKAKKDIEELERSMKV